MDTKEYTTKTTKEIESMYNVLLTTKNVSVFDGATMFKIGKLLYDCEQIINHLTKQMKAYIDELKGDTFKSLKGEELQTRINEINAFLSIKNEELSEIKHEIYIPTFTLSTFIAQRDYTLYNIKCGDSLVTPDFIRIFNDIIKDDL